MVNSFVDVWTEKLNCSTNVPVNFDENNDESNNKINECGEAASHRFNFPYKNVAMFANFVMVDASDSRIMWSQAKMKKGNRVQNQWMSSSIFCQMIYQLIFGNVSPFDVTQRNSKGRSWRNPINTRHFHRRLCSFSVDFHSNWSFWPSPHCPCSHSYISPTHRRCQNWVKRVTSLALIICGPLPDMAALRRIQHSHICLSS